MPILKAKNSYKLSIFYTLAHPSLPVPCSDRDFSLQTEYILKLFVLLERPMLCKTHKADKQFLLK